MEPCNRSINRIIIMASSLSKSAHQKLRQLRHAKCKCNRVSPLRMEFFYEYVFLYGARTVLKFQFLRFGKNVVVRST